MTARPSVFLVEPFYFASQVKTEQASKFCERVSTRRTVKSLETEIIQKNRRIETEERKYEHCTLLAELEICSFFRARSVGFTVTP